MEDSDGDEVPLNQVQNHLFQGAESGYDSENTAHDDGRVASNHSEGYEDDDSLAGAADDSRPGNEDLYNDDDEDLDEDEQAEDGDEDEDEDEVEVEVEEIEEEEVDEDEDGEEAEEAEEAEEIEVDAQEREDFELEKEEMSIDQMVSQQAEKEIQHGGNQASHYEEDDDDEDDVPLAARINAVQPPSPKVQNLRFFKSREDDDVPLATLHKRYKPKQRRRAKAPTGARSGRGSKTTTVSRSRRETKREPKPRSRPKQPKKEKESAVRKFEKVGQRKETPAENDPLRLFYQSMYREKLSKGKHSFVAENWCLRHGLLEEEAVRDVMSRWDLAR